MFGARVIEVRFGDLLSGLFGEDAFGVHDAVTILWRPKYAIKWLEKRSKIDLFTPAPDAELVTVYRYFLEIVAPSQRVCTGLAVPLL